MKDKIDQLIKEANNLANESNRILNEVLPNLLSEFRRTRITKFWDEWNKQYELSLKLSSESEKKYEEANTLCNQLLLDR